MHLRSISKDIVEKVIDKPDNKTFEDGLTVFQRILSEGTGQPFLFRVFVNKKRIPNLIVTIYKTSKIQKYYEGQV